MTLQVLSESDVLKKLNFAAVKNALKDAFLGLSTGESVQPSQTVTVFPSDEGDCIFYPGVLWSKKLIGVKLSPYIAGLSKQGKYPVTAYTMLMSAITGEPVLVCDSLALTTIRTAATTSLALDYLIPKSAKRLAIVGAGKVAIQHLDYVKQQHDWSDITVFSPTLVDKNSKRYSDVGEKLTGYNARIAESVKQAVSDADVILLCTSSGKPVIEIEWTKPNAVITSISTNVPKAHEIPPTALNNMSVFCDYRLTAPLSAGEMVIAKAEHNWSESKIVADIPELVSGKYSETSSVSGRVFFRSIGLGLEDLAIASLLI